MFHREQRIHRTSNEERLISKGNGTNPAPSGVFIWRTHPGARSLGSMPGPDIQQLLARHLRGTEAEKRQIERTIQRNEAKRRAKRAALRAMKLVEAKEHDKARGVAVEAQQWYRVWRKLGGKGPLT